MGSMESCVPPGFRFHPTEEELVGYYLRKKAASQKIDLDVIRDIDLYRIEPWDLKDRCRIGYEEQNEWYFFSHKDKKYPTGTRTNRATVAGFWKATGRDKAICDKTSLIGMRKTLVFYNGRAPRGQKTDWIMHEYRLKSNENSSPKEEGWMVCRAFKKKTTTLTKNTKSWLDTGRYFNDEPSGMSSIIDPTECISRLTQQECLKSHFMCKQEKASAADNLLFFNNLSDNFLQLPRLESPSVPLMKRPSLEEEANNIARKFKSRTVGSNSDIYCRNSMTDWRALDMFVASQLSQDNKLYEGVGEPTTMLDEPRSSVQDHTAAPFLLHENEGVEEDES